MAEGLLTIAPPPRSDVIDGVGEAVLKAKNSQSEIPPWGTRPWFNTVVAEGRMNRQIDKARDRGDVLPTFTPEQKPK